MDRGITQYLGRYAEPECLSLAAFPAVRFDHCIVIPAYAESPGFVERLQSSVFANGDLLIILVINQPDDLPTDPSNQKLLQHFEKRYTLVWQKNNLALYSLGDGSCHWLLVNRTDDTLKIPRKKGVGLARKIGCDLALSLFHDHKLSHNWIRSTDADAHLPPDYLAWPDAQISEGQARAAALYRFQHLNDSSATGRATSMYERALNYYVAGLRWAGSPYAFHTVGSTLAINLFKYAQVRGFPARAGGEDFYLLNKLAKVGNIHAQDMPLIKLEARTSQRVPFGTGPAVEKILLSSAQGRDFLYYNPAVFVDLKQWLEQVPVLWNKLAADAPLQQDLSAPVQDALQSLRIHELEAHLRQQAKNSADCIKFTADWFDAFRTLKFIRYLSDQVHPPLPLDHCIRWAPFNV